jgi:hypothetical protein
MGLPAPPNTTCDIYRSGNAPPSAPDVAGQQINLAPIYLQGLERGEGDSTFLKATHRILCDMAVDIRDGYDLGVIANADTVYVPHQSGTGFSVIFTEIVDLGMAATQHKRVYLARNLPTYPTNNL